MIEHFSIKKEQLDQYYTLHECSAIQGHKEIALFKYIIWCKMNKSISYCLHFSGDLQIYSCQNNLDITEYYRIYRYSLYLFDMQNYMISGI